MTDKSDTQTNPKTQPLYFKPWEDIEDGEKVILFYEHSNPSGIVYQKKGENLFFVDENKKSNRDPKKYRYIELPQDRPKPNIWDDWVGLEKNSFNGFKFIGFDGTSENIHHGDILNNPKQARALAAWINHVLDGE